MFNYNQFHSVMCTLLDSGITVVNGVFITKFPGKCLPIQMRNKMFSNIRKPHVLMFFWQ